MSEDLKKRWEHEQHELANKLYAVLMPVLANYEHRGMNAHSRAQAIVAGVIVKADDWIRRYMKTNPDIPNEVTTETKQGEQK